MKSQLALLCALLSSSSCALSSDTKSPSADTPGDPAATGGDGAQAAGTTTAASGGGTTTDTPAAAQPAAEGTAATSGAAAGAQVKAVAWPSLEFRNDPAGLGDRVVALSFDDGPDGTGSPEGKAGKSNTSTVVDHLATLGLKATFFLCSKKTTLMASDPAALSDVQKILAGGHQVGNHSATHVRYDPSWSSTTLASEWGDVQATLSKLLGAQAPTLAVWRLPYGVPAQGSSIDKLGNKTDPAAMTTLAGSDLPPAVHVGWGIDTHDNDCATSDSERAKWGNDAHACIMGHLKRFTDAGSSGVVLMHSIFKSSADALPDVVAALKARGYTFSTVEAMIEKKYGATAVQLTQAALASPVTKADQIAAATASMQASAWYQGTNAD